MELGKICVAFVAVLAAKVSFAAAKESPSSLPRRVKENIDALVQAAPAQRVTPGIAVAISTAGILLLQQERVRRVELKTGLKAAGGFSINANGNELIRRAPMATAFLANEFVTRSSSSRRRLVRPVEC